MNADEVANLIVRLTGDGSLFQRMMTTAQESSVKAASVIQSAGARIESFQGGITRFAQTALGALAGLGVATSFMGMIHAAGELEANTIRMTSAIKAHGGAVDSILPAYQAFAKQMESVSTLSKGAVMGLLRTAETMGFSGDKAKEMATNAIGLAGALNIDADSAFHMVQQVERGNVHMLAHALGMKRGADAATVLAQANKMVAQGLETQAALADTIDVQLEKLGRSLGDVGKEAGAMLATYLKPIVEWARGLIEQIKKLTPETKTHIATVIALGGAILLINPALAAMSMLFGLLQIKLIASTAWWAISTVATTAATIAMTAFNIAASMGVLGFVALAAAIAVVAVGAVGMYQGILAISDVLKLLSSESLSPLAAITAIFGEWWDIIKKVVQAARVDMALAWEMVAAGGTLAVLQIKALWPPLWEYIKRGFEQVWMFVAQNARITLLETLRQVTAAQALALRQNAIAGLDAGLRLAARNFEIIETEEIRAARARVAAISGAIEDAVTASDAARTAAHSSGLALGNAMKAGLDAVKLGPAILSGSVEAIRAIADYNQSLQAKPVATGVSGTDAATVSAVDRSTGVLREIRDRLPVGGAGLGAADLGVA